MYNILHLVETSFPVIAGYTVRTHNIILNQKDFANPIALTSRYFKRTNNPEYIKNVCYFRYPSNKILSFMEKTSILHQLRVTPLFNTIYHSRLANSTRFIKRLSSQYQIDLIHGHTPESFSKYGEKTARNLKIPFVYEIRGFQEETLLTYGSITKKSRLYKKRKKREINLMTKADLIITLGISMEKEIRYMGINGEKLKIVPNGVDVDYFKPNKINLNLKERLFPKDVKIIGFIGTVRRLEGLEILIKALNIVKKPNENVQLFIIGRCHDIYKAALNRLINSLNLNKNVQFIGQVPYEVIKDYYSLIDVHILPRIDSKVTRTVTPLKPLEVMAMSKPLIASKLPALEELIKPKISGELFEPGDYVELAEKIKNLINNKDDADKLGERARKYVVENHSWKSITLKYKKIYDTLLD